MNVKDLKNVLKRLPKDFIILVNDKNIETSKVFITCNNKGEWAVHFQTKEENQ